MSYTFNPHHHVKIWLSKKPDSFLNFENQKRLIIVHSNLSEMVCFVQKRLALSKTMNVPVENIRELGIKELFVIGVG